MPKIIKKIVPRILTFMLCTAIAITAPILMATRLSIKSNAETNQMTMLTIWQIDSFEGGKGSRSNYLKTAFNECFRDEKTYVNVLSITASAARQNLIEGVIPDIISYGAGTYGIEGIISGNPAYITWAHGGYCFLTIDESADFSDINNKNTIINCGTDNLSSAVALLCGVEKSIKSTPTGAYVDLISGKYKYLLGTQRDIYRLKSRGLSFNLKPVTQFNDLYQNISITTTDTIKITIARKFLEYLNNNSKNLVKLGLMGNEKIYDDEMSPMEAISYDYKLTTPLSEAAHMELLDAINKSDINLLKKLLK